MPDEIVPPEQQRNNEARALIKRMHPNYNRYPSRSDEVGIGSMLALLVQIARAPQNADTWGEKIDKWSADERSNVKIGGSAKDGTFRPLITIALRAPDDFLKIVRAYLDEGNIPQDLLETPIYTPMTTVVNAEHGAFDEDDDERSDRDTPDAIDASEEFKKHIAEATEFYHLRSIHLATTAHFTQHMRERGVLSALDKKTEVVINREIREADTDEKFSEAEEHIVTFPFDDKEIAPRLKKALEDRRVDRLPAEAMYPPLNEFEIRASEVKTIGDLVQVAEATRSGIFKSADERERTIKSINGYAKKILVNECNHSASIEAFKNVYEKARRFPFSDMEYGFQVLDIIEMRAKYFLFGHILATRSDAVFESLQKTTTEFPFWRPENSDNLNAEIDLQRRLAHRVQRKSRQ